MSEFRKDLVTGDWIIVSPERAKRPHEFLPKKKKRLSSPKSKCPFEDLEKTGNWPLTFSYPNDEKWEVALFPNKYPALGHSPVCAIPSKNGPYDVHGGIGYHDLVVTRDHDKHIVDSSLDEGVKVFEMFQKRFQMVAKDKCAAYTSAFLNFGASAGASLHHPHYQVLTLPIVPPSVEQSLEGSRKYFQKNKRCVHCDILTYERKNKSRIVEENESAIVISPFVPRSRFEISVYPKKHFASFEETPMNELRGIVQALQSSLKRVRKYLNDPDLNFFIHTAPLKNKAKYSHYHWHIDILPKISIPAGFELSTGVDIVMIDPDKLASLLRGEKV